MSYLSSIFYILFYIKKVTWIRHRDLHLLTVGKSTYTSDQRYQSVHNPHTDDWALKVRFNKKKKQNPSSFIPDLSCCFYK